MRASFSIIRSTNDYLFIRDTGQWGSAPTITNDAENVIQWLYENKLIIGKRLFYLDSEDEFGELLHQDGVFKGFKTADREEIK